MAAFFGLWTKGRHRRFSVLSNLKTPALKNKQYKTPTLTSFQAAIQTDHKHKSQIITTHSMCTAIIILNTSCCKVNISIYLVVIQRRNKRVHGANEQTEKRGKYVRGEMSNECILCHLTSNDNSVVRHPTASNVCTIVAYQSVLFIMLKLQAVSRIGHL